MLTEPSILSEFETIDSFLVSCENCQYTKKSTLHNPRWPELILLFTISWGIIIIIKKRDPDYTLKEKWFRGDRNLGPPLFSHYCSLLSDPIFLCVSVFSHIFFCQIHLVSHSVNYGSYEEKSVYNTSSPIYNSPYCPFFPRLCQIKVLKPYTTHSRSTASQGTWEDNVGGGERKGAERNKFFLFVILFHSAYKIVSFLLWVLLTSFLKRTSGRSFSTILYIVSSHSFPCPRRKRKRKKKEKSEREQKTLVYAYQTSKTSLWEKKNLFFLLLLPV